jgi:hypothetical protein
MADDPMDEVVGRVSNALSGADYDARFRWEGEWLCADDLRALLAAFQSVREENARLRERDEWAQREFKRWGQELQAERDRARWGGTE